MLEGLVHGPARRSSAERRRRGPNERPSLDTDSVPPCRPGSDRICRPKPPQRAQYPLIREYTLREYTLNYRCLNIMI